MSREREPVSGEGEGERKRGEKKRVRRVEEETKKSWGGAAVNPWVQCVCPAEKMLLARSAISWPPRRSVLLRFSPPHYHYEVHGQLYTITTD